ncbi:tetratricopeptide repeat protein 19, mitochondrial-like [Limulus polyphemus]|uniref:Tetratricopeptide repeat protein 19, mitochondrial-like n=1 Tax=Limulus polyphemus TaxID=6850 RepID=A0ABM1BCU6_LIMPO|nr:tetratricopeptide repeat protein 19, mitochondrial-like [Limulus polyphemus]
MAYSMKLKAGKTWSLLNSCINSHISRFFVTIFNRNLIGEEKLIYLPILQRPTKVNGNLAKTSNTNSTSSYVIKNKSTGPISSSRPRNTSSITVYKKQNKSTNDIVNNGVRNINFVCHPFYSSGQEKYPGTKSFIRRYALLAGILGSLGFQKDEEKEEVLISTIKRGVLSIQKGDLNTAEQILHVALKIAEDEMNPQGITYIYDLLANIAFEKQEHQKAEALFVEVMKRMIASGTPKDDNAILEMSLKLSTIYSEQKLEEKAEDGFRYCFQVLNKRIQSIDLEKVDIFTETEQDDIILWAMSCDWYARHLMSKGDLKNAQQLYEKSLAVSEKVNGPSHPKTLILMNDIGSVASMRKDFDVAISYLNQAIDRGTVEESSDLPSFYCNLGVTLMQKGDLQNAFKTCDKGFQLARKLKNKVAQSEAKKCIEEVKKVKNTKL